MNTYFLFTVAKLQETMRVTIYNLDFQASVAEVKKILKKADLEGHGFSKEVSFKLVKGSGRDKPEYQVCLITVCEDTSLGSYKQ